MPKIVIEIRGGLYEQAYTDVNDLEVVIVDWDLINYQGGMAESLEPIGLKRLPDETLKQIDLMESYT